MKIKLILPIFVMILIAANVFAVGVTSDYWSERPLTMHKGESKVIQLLLQNMVGNEDVIMSAEIIEGNEIAQIIDKNKEYKVPIGRKDVPVNIKVTIPTNAKDRYTLAILFKTLPDPERGVLQFATGVEKRFDVVVTDSQPAPSAQVVETATQEPILELPTSLSIPNEKKAVYGLIAVIVILIVWILYQKAKYQKLRKEETRHRKHK